MTRDIQTEALPFRRLEQRQRNLVVDLLERDLDRHVENQRLRSLRAIDDVGHHPWTLVEFDDRDRVGRGKARHWPVVDHIGVEPPPAAGAEYRDVARGAFRAERPRREIGLPAGIAALQAQFAGARSLPEMHRFGRRHWPRPLYFGHSSFPG